MTVNELGGRSSKLFVENVNNSGVYQTTIFNLPNMVFEKTYPNSSNMHRQNLGYAGEKFYFKNVPQKLLEIYNPNHTLWKSIRIPVPTNGGSTRTFDPVFFADDKIFDTDSLVEFVFSFDIGTGYGLV